MSKRECQMGCNFDPDTQAWIEAEAKRRERSISYIVRMLVKLGLPHIRKMKPHDH